MKNKKVMLLFMLILSLNVSAQYAGVTVLNKGIGVNVGAFSNKVSMEIGLVFPIMALQNPNVYSLRGGYEIDFGDNFNFTPVVGAALLKIRTWTFNDAVIVYKAIKPIYGVELGKDAHIGRGFITATFVGKSAYYGLGMKVFFNR